MPIPNQGQFGEESATSEKVRVDATDHSLNRPRVSLEKANDTFKPIAEWWLACGNREKPAAFVMENLCRHDPGLNASGRYDGDIGWDIRADWIDRLRTVLGDESATPDPRDRIMLASVLNQVAV